MQLLPVAKIDRRFRALPVRFAPWIGRVVTRVVSDEEGDTLPTVCSLLCLSKLECMPHPLASRYLERAKRLRQSLAPGVLRVVKHGEEYDLVLVEHGFEEPIPDEPPNYWTHPVDTKAITERQIAILRSVLAKGQKT